MSRFWSANNTFIDSLPEPKIQSRSSRGPIALHRIDNIGESERIPLLDPPSGDYVSIRMTQPIWFTLSTQSGKTLFELVGDRAESKLWLNPSYMEAVNWQDGVAWLADGKLLFESTGVVESLVL